uniref:Uncharacterized protein n=1 Tax=Strigamia maritima TaxID=126957 RepID=T1IQD6_STRMM
MRLSSALAVTSSKRNLPVTPCGAEGEISDVHFLEELNRKLRTGWTAHTSIEGRIYYCNACLEFIDF